MSVQAALRTTLKIHKSLNNILDGCLKAEFGVIEQYHFN